MIYYNKKVIEKAYRSRIGPNLDNPNDSIAIGAGQAQINELYHEATHAYFDLKLGHESSDGLWSRYKKIERKLFSKEYEKVYDESISYYKRKVLLADHDQLFYEAAAMYIGFRAGLLWDTLDKLEHRKSMIKSHPEKSSDIVDSLVKIVLEYKTAASERVFGYYGDNTKTKAKIFPALKKLCDEILEDSVPDNFFASPQLRNLYFEINNIHIASVNEQIANGTH